MSVVDPNCTKKDFNHSQLSIVETIEPYDMDCTLKQTVTEMYVVFTYQLIKALQKPPCCIKKCHMLLR